MTCFSKMVDFIAHLVKSLLEGIIQNFFKMLKLYISVYIF